MAKRKAAATAASSRRANSPTSGTRPAVAAQVYDYVRTIPDVPRGKPRRRVVEQHTLTPAQAAAWQSTLREQGFKDAEFVPAK
jgi:hypothetical protein